MQKRRSRPPSAGIGAEGKGHGVQSQISVLKGQIAEVQNSIG